jgi:tRNA-modifying protein YgfZ
VATGTDSCKLIAVHSMDDVLIMAGEPMRLPQLAVIRFGGADAIGFLQGQFSNDVERLADGRTQLAAYATPQGRAIALLRLRRLGSEIYALLPAALADPVIVRLQRFVLRARVEISRPQDWGVAWTADGIDGTPARAAGDDPALSFELPDGRRVVAGPGLAAGEAPDVAERWTASDIAAGFPEIGPATSEHFVPQMLNLDLLDAISFDKGCYTGQEIVARTQNLGRIKRRTFRYSAATDTPFAPLTGLHRDGAKVGEVLASARIGDGVELLAVVALDARDLPLRAPSGHSVLPLPLPYSV